MASFKIIALLLAAFVAATTAIRVDMESIGSVRLTIKHN